MNYKIILRNSLMLSIDELKKKNNIRATNYYIHICPDTSEKEVSRLSSMDLYYRDEYSF